MGKKLINIVSEYDTLKLLLRHVRARRVSTFFSVLCTSLSGSFVLFKFCFQFVLCCSAFYVLLVSFPALINLFAVKNWILAGIGSGLFAIFFLVWVSSKTSLCGHFVTIVGMALHSLEQYIMYYFDEKKTIIVIVKALLDIPKICCCGCNTIIKAICGFLVPIVSCLCCAIGGIGTLVLVICLIVFYDNVDVFTPLAILLGISLFLFAFCWISLLLSGFCFSASFVYDLPDYFSFIFLIVNKWLMWGLEMGGIENRSLLSPMQIEEEEDPVKNPVHISDQDTIKLLARFLFSGNLCSLVLSTVGTVLSTLFQVCKCLFPSMIIGNLIIFIIVLLVMIFWTFYSAIVYFSEYGFEFAMLLPIYVLGSFLIFIFMLFFFLVAVICGYCSNVISLIWNSIQAAVFNYGCKIKRSKSDDMLILGKLALDVPKILCCGITSSLKLCFGCILPVGICGFMFFLGVIGGSVSVLILMNTETEDSYTYFGEAFGTAALVFFTSLIGIIVSFSLFACFCFFDGFDYFMLLVSFLRNWFPTIERRMERITISLETEDGTKIEGLGEEDDTDDKPEFEGTYSGMDEEFDGLEDDDLDLKELEDDDEEEERLEDLKKAKDDDNIVIKKKRKKKKKKKKIKKEFVGTEGLDSSETERSSDGELSTEKMTADDDEDENIEGSSVSEELEDVQKLDDIQPKIEDVEEEKIQKD